MSRTTTTTTTRLHSSASTRTGRHAVRSDEIGESLGLILACLAASAYFDPSGTKILSTSYDDYMRIWSVDPSKLGEPIEDFEPAAMAVHDNTVGRYVTVFKAQWSRNPNVTPYWTSGNMKRSLDIYAADGTCLVKLHDPQITTIPAVTASHPSIIERAYGGNASGKINVWGPALEEDADEEADEAKEEED